eukprot:TRINITY_DN48706_c0_g1_i1.p1 TRINITY_DN48706_c0_g1~~TRINITY_DN48706_c0_g1_i1.p1  ORF type:complete len:439 (+),score=32.96 TRINITY_DN48706_c0_g1_i1:91-1407(+)
MPQTQPHVRFGETASPSWQCAQPEIRVKNTFIDVDERPSEHRGDRRYKTEPGMGRDLLAACFCSQDEDSEGASEDLSEIHRPGDVGKSGRAFDHQQEQPGERRPTLQTLKTYDHFNDLGGSPISQPAASSPAWPTLQTLKTHDNFSDLERSPVSQLAASSPAPTPSQCPSTVAGTAAIGFQAPQMQGLMGQPGSRMQMVTLPVVQGQMPVQAGVMQMVPLQGGHVQIVPMQPIQSGQMIGFALPGAPVSTGMYLMPAGMQPGVPATAWSGSVVNSSSPVPVPTAVPSSAASSTQQAKGVECSEAADGSMIVRWAVEARKLTANDKSIVSPTFEIGSKIPGTFRIMLHPSRLSKRGVTFKNSDGKGSISLKCDSPPESESMREIRFFIGDGRSETPRGPVLHDFSESGVCSLPRDKEEWDFTKAVDRASKNLFVCVQIS